MTTAETESAIRGWLTGRLPEWFEGPVEVVVDRDEITVTGALKAPDVAPDASDAERSAAAKGRAKAFREQTREQRIQIARELEAESGRSVSWCVRVGEDLFPFTTQAVPVMTRLRQPERRVLDTLVASGVARSRADALAWCVRLVGQNADEWLSQLDEALQEVHRVRAGGPHL